MTTEIYLIANIFELLAELLYLKKILDVKVSGWRLILVWVGLFTVDEIAAAYVNVPTRIALSIMVENSSSAFCERVSSS